jgi:hydrogenase maturation factor
VLQELLLELVQSLMDFLNWVWIWVQQAVAYLLVALQYVWDTLVEVGKWVLAHVSVLIDGLRKAARAVWRGFQGLLHLNFRKIWDAIKRGYDRLHRALDWYMRHVQGPIDRLRRQVMDIYNRFFKPILRVLDTFRVMVRIVAVFNRKLAAKLDSRLFALESKLMYPITATLKRLNEISSHLRAIITALGYLDRVLILETLRRDALLVWEVLTNPRERIFDRGKPAPAGTVHQVGQDARDYLLHGVGPYAELEPDWKRTFESVYEDMR